MAYTNVYPTRINWENEPNINTPLNAVNLNKIDYAVYEHDRTLATWDTTKANQSDLLLSVKSIDYDTDTGVFVFTWQNGTIKTVDLNIEKIPVSFSMDANGVITMTTDDGTQYTADVGSLIKTYIFNDSSVIDFTVTTDASGNKTVTADIVDGSITGTKLQPNYLADCTAAKTAAELAETGAEDSAEDAEAWAVGQRNGVDVPSTDPVYENSAKYWANHARSALANLTDVNITNPQDKQALTYDATTQKWVNGETAGGAQIDDTTTAADKVWSSNKINTELGLKVDKTAITNPNLLDNPWFTVNQRGASSYTTNVYCVDRWKLTNVNVTINADDSVTINHRATGSAGYFQQYCETDLRDRLLGRTVTFSAIIDDVLYSASATFPATVQTGYDIVLLEIETELYLRLRINGSGVLCAYIDFESNYSTSTTHTIKAIKLELGSVSTLAMDTVPNYAEEFLKCQRYCVILGGTGRGSRSLFTGFMSDATHGAILIPVYMRATPVVTYSGNIFLRTSYVDKYAITGIPGIDGGKDQPTFLSISVGTNLTVGAPCQLRTENDGVIILSADL